MSEMEKHEDISRYNSMSTQELQEILRKHAHGELDTEPDTQELYEIMEVLSVRRQNEFPQAFRSDEEALADFRKHYMPKAKREGRAKAIRFHNRAFRMVAAVLVIVLILVVGTSVTVEAFHVDIWGKFANWTKEIFQFADLPQGTTAANPEKEHNLELKPLNDVLTQEGVEDKLIPTWMPEGYRSKDLQITITPRARHFLAIYEKNESDLIIKIRQTIGVPADQIEKSEDLLEIYTANSVDYYIFSNNASLQVAWSVGEFECVIGGKLTLEEIKAMINSIS